MAFSLGGLWTKATGEVLTEDGEVVEGLVSAGRSCCGISRSAEGYVSGTSIGDATFFGRLAGRSAAARSRGGGSKRDGSDRRHGSEEMIEGLRATPRQLLLYVCFYQAWGLVSNGIGQAIALAQFAQWWQTLTRYLLYLVPASLLVRRKSLAEQYVYGLLILAPLELPGYALGTSIA